MAENNVKNVGKLKRARCVFEGGKGCRFLKNDISFLSKGGF